MTTTAPTAALGTQTVAITVADTAAISETLPAPLSGSESAAISLAGFGHGYSEPGDTLTTTLTVTTAPSRWAPGGRRGDKDGR